ncbi:transmembrane protein, putative (macronuclear) [Tetrahymena thermophila SB210]|uniref:Transmembrane protein, putative n=1 Tax=Tetrahymena thermophila (strain SB210) TaxID=312017 RepID=I7MDL6_TETTS|nr:transmembrane protein, putative [Tetrahymena thermophila SB210]EAR89362.3 transmembrane protein, putative [Tetrahymena thermophila SB210]|eukprot:XP_001009607.3 transmembrane protein, putative [Tetrahymena thermophila SB210]
MDQYGACIDEDTYKLIYGDLEGANYYAHIFCLIQVIVFGVVLLWLIYRLIQIFIWCKQNMENIFLNKFVHIHSCLIACHLLLIIIELLFYTNYSQISNFKEKNDNSLCCQYQDCDKIYIGGDFYKFASTQDLLYYFLFFFFCFSIVLACIYWFNIIFNISNILILVQILLGSLIFVFAFIYKILMDSAMQALYNEPDKNNNNSNSDIFKTLVEINYYFYHCTIIGIVFLIGIFFVGSIIKIRKNLEKIYMISHKYKIKLISENVSIAIITLTKLIYHFLCLFIKGYTGQSVLSYFSGFENIICYGLNGYFLSKLFFPTRQMKIDALNTFEQNMEQDDEHQYIQEGGNAKKSDEISFINQKGDIKQE